GRALRRRGVLSGPPAQTSRVALTESPSAAGVALMAPPSSAYAFSRVKTRKPNRSPANSTDGSGKSKLNFWNARPRGGTNTSLVEVSGRIVSAGRSGAGGKAGRSAPAPAAPTVLSQSRRVRGSSTKQEEPLRFPQRQ